MHTQFNSKETGKPLEKWSLDDDNERRAIRFGGHLGDYFKAIRVTSRLNEYKFREKFVF